MGGNVILWQKLIRQLGYRQSNISVSEVLYFISCHINLLSHILIFSYSVNFSLCLNILMEWNYEINPVKP